MYALWVANRASVVVKFDGSEFSRKCWLMQKLCNQAIQHMICFINDKAFFNGRCSIPHFLVIMDVQLRSIEIEVVVVFF